MVIWRCKSLYTPLGTPLARTCTESAVVSLTDAALSQTTPAAYDAPQTQFHSPGVATRQGENVRFAIYCRPSVCLSVVCNVRAPYSGGSDFRQYFYGVRYLGHPLTSTENFMEIVQGEPLRRGNLTHDG